MNDLPLHVVSPLDMYADDTTFSVTGETIEELEIKLKADLTNVQNVATFQNIGSQFGSAHSTGLGR